jgi:hypothetical protein
LKRSRSSTVLILLLLAPLAGAQAPDNAAAYPGFDTRYGIPPRTELRSLIDRPSLISMSARKYRDDAAGEWRLEGFGEAQGVYDIGFPELLSVLDDPTAALSYSPRLLDARIEEKEGPRIVTFQHVGLNFLGIKLGYRFRAEQVRDDLAPGEVGYRVRLLESLDGTFFEAYTSWYAKEVLVDGRRLVYLRTYTRPGIRNPGLGMELIIKNFTAGELRSTLDRVAREAGRRSTSLDSGPPRR